MVAAAATATTTAGHFPGVAAADAAMAAAAATAISSKPATATASLHNKARLHIPLSLAYPLGFHIDPEFLQTGHLSSRLSEPHMPLNPKLPEIMVSS